MSGKWTTLGKNIFQGLFFLVLTIVSIGLAVAAFFAVPPVGDQSVEFACENCPNHIDTTGRAVFTGVSDNDVDNYLNGPHRTFVEHHICETDSAGVCATQWHIDSAVAVARVPYKVHDLGYGAQELVLKRREQLQVYYEVEYSRVLVLALSGLTAVLTLVAIILLFVAVYNFSKAWGQFRRPQTPSLDPTTRLS